MAKQQIIKGSDLMLFDASGKSYAYATNHTFTMNAETSDISSKDNGVWTASEVVKYTWEITSENLYTATGYDTMFASMIGATPIKVIFGVRQDEGGKTVYDDDDLDNWTKGTTYYEGSALITSLVANANNGENATYSVTFTGVGKVEKK